MPSATSSLSFLAAFFFALSPTMTVADVFLSKGAPMLSTAEVSGILFEEIKGFFGQDSAKGRLAEVERLLSPMYTALPKEAATGGLGHATVRYALHRFFAQQHAWHLVGLEPTGGAWNETSPTGILADHVPSYIQGLFEDYLGDAGFGLHELAVLAVALEHIVKAETVARIESAYAVMSYSTSTVLQAGSEVESVLDTHQVLYLLSRNLKNKSASMIRNVMQKMVRIYPGWEDTRMFVRDTQGNLAYAERDITNPFVPAQFDFSRIAHIIENVNDQFGHFQDIECRETKDLLLQGEYKDSGRMRLADFYSFGVLNGDRRFSESEEYLRQIGALDDSVPTDPRVIIANYMYGKNNCFQSSSYYSVCCLDECETLLGHVEQKVAAPEASPKQLAEVVSHMSSSTVVAPRNLSALLLQRLEDIAQLHDGSVPLHGRLFAQFMHHAFPRECSHPHISGTTNQVSPKEFELQTGKKVVVAQDELRRRASEHNLTVSSGGNDYVDAQPLPWQDEEELLVPRGRGTPRTQSRSGLCLTATAMFAAVAVVAYGLVQKIQTTRSSLRIYDDSKQFV